MAFGVELDLFGWFVAEGMDTRDVCAGGCFGNFEEFEIGMVCFFSISD